MRRWVCRRGTVCGEVSSFLFSNKCESVCCHRQPSMIRFYLEAEKTEKLQTSVFIRTDKNAKRTGVVRSMLIQFGKKIA